MIITEVLMIKQQVMHHIYPGANGHPAQAYIYIVIPRVYLGYTIVYKVNTKPCHVYTFILAYGVLPLKTAGMSTFVPGWGSGFIQKTI